jgi:mycothiol S-conjugate amidase
VAISQIQRQASGASTALTLRQPAASANAEYGGRRWLRPLACLSVPQPLCLLTVHAHPDDEASKGAPTLARYKAEGVRTVLVCCTGGEAGEVLNPAMDRPEVRERMAEFRAEELARAAEVIGFAEVVMLGYRDSGMPDTEANHNPAAFANADLDEATGRLVAVLRRTRPQVVLTYNDDQTGYPHPDHLRVHDISVAAFDRSGDPEWYPELGEPWQPLKMYYSMWSRERVVAVHEALMRLRGSSPYGDDWLDRPSHDERITTRIDVRDFLWARSQALRAHATQIDPNEPFWFGLTDEELAAVYPYEDWVLAKSLVGYPPEGEREDDLFDGIRQRVS